MNTVVRVDFGTRGRWDVGLDDQSERVTSYTLDDARRLAHVFAQDRDPCQLIICDAYHRVVHGELVTRSRSVQD